MVSRSRRSFMRIAAVGVGLGLGLDGQHALDGAQAGSLSSADEPAGFPKTISLNGIWNYHPIARTTIRDDGSITKNTTNLPAKGRMPVPSNWQLNGLPGFNGRVRFDREFRFDESLHPAKRAFLVLHGVDYFAEVELNGTTLGKHEGYFQKFEFDVTRQIRNGVNHLAITVDAPLEEKGTVFPQRKRLIKGVLLQWTWNPGSVDDDYVQQQTSAGIWNRVELEIRSMAWVDHIKIQPVLHEQGMPRGMKPSDADFKAEIYVSGEIHAAAPGYYDVRFEAGGAGTASKLKIDGQQKNFTLVLQLEHPRLWWTWELGEPYLYPGRIVLSSDGREVFARTCNFGVRRIELDENTGQWKLNGLRFFMRGTNVIPDLWLAHYTPDRIERDVKMLREANVNAVRVCVHVNRHEFYDALDRGGILAWQGFALQWNYNEGTEFMQNAASQIRDMIRQFYNHPSIATWNCQNEPEGENFTVLDPFLAQVGRQEDSSRPVRSASQFREHIYQGWYAGNYQDYACTPRGPIISELGAQALPSLEETVKMAGNSWPPDWIKLTHYGLEYDPTLHVALVSPGSSMAEFVENSQRYQADLLKFAIEHYRRVKYRKIGTFLHFMFMDAMPAVSWSVLSYDRKPKLAYGTLKQAFQPVLVGAALNLDRWSKGRYLNRNLIGILGGSAATITPWVVNDLHELFKNVSLEIKLENGERSFKVEQSSEDIEIPPDSVIHLPAVHYNLPEDAAAGNYVLVLRLNQGTQKLSENSYPVMVVE
jgi:beta-mannosidase